MKTTWEDGTPRSSGNAFDVVYQPSVMAKDISHKLAEAARAKRGKTEKAPHQIHIKKKGR